MSSPVPLSSRAASTTTTTSLTASTSASSTSILTPPGEVPDVLPPPGAHSSSGSQSSYYSSHMSSPWPTSGGSQLSAYSYANSNSGTPSSGPLAQSPYARAPPSYPPTSSPSLQHFPGRSSSSAPNGEGLPALQSYHQEQSAFPSPVATGGTGAVGGGALGSPQSQGGHQQPGLAQPMLATQSPGASRPTAPGQGVSGGPTATQEGNSYRPPPTPTNCYPSTSTPQQGSFPQFASPVSQSSPSTSPATSSGPVQRGLASIPPMAPPLQYSSGRGHGMPPIASYASYGQVPGPVLSNMHHPGSPLAMVSGMQGLGGYGHHPGLPPHHQLYMHHPSAPAQQPDRDRPFKCNQCPQAFNRNHDLKRHKRIHMAVKPFPCLDCDKRFSRKDALKVSRAKGRLSRYRRDLRALTNPPASQARQRVRWQVANRRVREHGWRERSVASRSRRGSCRRQRRRREDTEERVTGHRPKKNPAEGAAAATEPLIRRAIHRLNHETSTDRFLYRTVLFPVLFLAKEAGKLVAGF